MPLKPERANTMANENPLGIAGNDPLQWRVLYVDGEIQHQIHPETGEKSAYEAIDRARLGAFHLIRPDGTLVFAVNFHNADGHRLVWRRRVTKRSDQEQGSVVHIVGKKDQFVAMVTQDGATILFDNFNSRDALLSFPDAVEGEIEWVDDGNSEET